MAWLWTGDKQLSHENVIKWKHFQHYWSFVWRIHWSPVNSPHKCQWRGTVKFFPDLRLNKRLSKQSRLGWFGTLSRPLWRHCNVDQWWPSLLIHICVTQSRRIYVNWLMLTNLGWHAINTITKLRIDPLDYNLEINVHGGILVHLETNQFN